MDSAEEFPPSPQDIVIDLDSEDEVVELPGPEAPPPALPQLALPQPVPAAAPPPPAAAPPQPEVQVGPAWNGPPAEFPMPEPLLPMQQFRVDQAKVGDENERVAGRDEHVVTRDSFRRLCYIGWLRESIISLFMRLIELRSRIDALNLPSIHALDPLFTFSLMRKRYEKPRVHQGGDIFNFDMVFCPINIESNHWALIVLHHSQKVLEYYDSMGGTNEAAIAAINEYVVVEHTVVRNELIEPYKVVLKTDIPLQENGRDCGVFVCLYAERLSRRAAFDFNQSHIQLYRQRIAYELLTGRLM